MKKNGFTLVELLAAIVILAIVTSMASVGVSSLRKGINKSMWNSTVELIENGAKNYCSDKKTQIKNIDVKLNMPIRYNNHFSSNERRLDYKKKYLSEDEFIKYKEMIDRQNESYKDNIILKLVRTFYRVKEMGDVININYMPFNTSDSINISINKNGSFNNDLCNLIYKKNNIIKK